MTILVATFTYKGDEELTKYNTTAIQSLRKLFPQHRIIHYLIDDANEPFDEPLKDEGDTYYIQSKFTRQKNLNGARAFIGIVRTLDILARKTKADWVVKLDSDTVLMDLDWLNDEYSYIGSSSPLEDKFYCWGSCVAYKPQAIHDTRMFARDEEKLDYVLNTCQRRGFHTGEDLLLGYVLVGRLGVKSLIQNINENKNTCIFINDNQTLNPNASCAACKGRYLHGLRSHSYIFVGNKELLSDESVLKRMKLAKDIIVQRQKRLN